MIITFDFIRKNLWFEDKRIQEESVYTTSKIDKYERLET